MQFYPIPDLRVEITGELVLTARPMPGSMKSLVLALALTGGAESKKKDALLDMIPARARGGKWFSHIHSKISSKDVFTNDTVNWFSQRIDHSGSESDATFQQRYYVDKTYCEDLSSCPIFMYIGGEGTLSATPGGYTAEMAQEHGALILALEHRWYGESLPGDITSTSDLTTLRLDLALLLPPAAPHEPPLLPFLAPAWRTPSRTWRNS